MNNIKKFKELKPFLTDADYSDVKTAEGNVSLRQFIASMLSYYPWWVIMLFRIREIIVRILGLARHEKPEKPPSLCPDDVPLTPGKNASFFIVRVAEDEHYWIAETPEDKHLKAYLAVVAEPLKDDIRCFHVITIVKYKHWTGPVYFNIIRPFHHLVVSKMTQAGVN
ncbi:DUF2867 domain-containing protein [Desulfococcaceae bacterium HSG8]|nr:DUF2867 domain-containing protein [Desulfococcaceae bacterium HSG8]